MKKTESRAILLQPPPGDLTGPYPALPYLKAFAEPRGHRTWVRDLGIEAFHFLAREEQLKALVQRASRMRERLEAKGRLEQDEQRQYALLASAVWMERNLRALGDAVKTFGSARRFRDYRQYKRSCRVLDAFFRLLSAAHFPAEIGPADFTSAQSVNSPEGVFAFCDPSLNPYVSYYEEVLCPQIAEYRPTAIGISMEFAAQSVQAPVLAKILKERFPTVHITMGGAYLSQWVLLMQEPQLQWLFTCTDSVVCGEGEEAFTGLMDRLALEQAPTGLPNLIHIDRTTGTVHRFDQLRYPDVKELPPPDFSDLDLDAYLIPETVLPYSISRGCYWGKCVFCQNRYGDNRIRRYQTVPVDKALDEMSALAERYRTNHFNFSNDVIDPRYLERFSRAAIASGKHFVWNTDLRAEKEFDADLCRLMARAGLNSVAIGLESACRRTLDAMNKGKDIEIVTRVMKDLYDNGVATQAMGIFGFPGETESEAESTVEFLEDNPDRISYYVVGLLMVVPGSRMHEDPEKYGVSAISYEGNHLMAPLPIWTSETRISARAVNRLYARLERLEDRYVINEYPYVGSLSTNHGFLYFRQGPGILKQLKTEETGPYERLLDGLRTMDGQARTRNLKSLIARPLIPVELFRSPYPLDRMTPNRHAYGPSHALHHVGHLDYLLSPVNTIIPVGVTERQVLKHLDARKNLKSILSKFEGDELNRAVSFLLALASQGIVTV
ncbi:MAG: radical SAM protein [Desulfomonilaceae bacterium]|nr:radical SAM protein [Desulfomonilaceae bacterium]